MSSYAAFLTGVLDVTGISGLHETCGLLLLTQGFREIKDQSGVLITKNKRNAQRHYVKASFIIHIGRNNLANSNPHVFLPPPDAGS